MRFWMVILLMAGAALPAAADRDFLTTDEVDQVRLAQEPNARLKLYAQFARQRVDLLEYLLSQEKVGRSSLIHETLADFTKIIETIDVVADDALVRGVKIDEGIAAVAEAEREFLAVLEKIRESEPRDMERYGFALENAIDTTADSLEVSMEDLHDRQAGAVDREKQERRDLEKLMSPESARERRQQSAEMKKKEEEHKRKTPTLYRKGEKKAEEH